MSTTDAGPSEAGQGSMDAPTTTESAIPTASNTQFEVTVVQRCQDHVEAYRRGTTTFEEAILLLTGMLGLHNAEALPEGEVPARCNSLATFLN